MTIALKSDAGGAKGILQVNGVDILTANADGSVELGASPSQFNASKKLATMEAVQRALGNMSGVKVVTASQALTAADAGSVVLANIASGGVITLPAFADVVPGAKYYVQCGTATGAISVAAPAGMSFNAPNAGSVSSIAVQPGVAVEFIYLSSNTILATNGSGMAALTANGYQKLPSGLIVQWGSTGNFLVNTASSTSTTVTFPIAFPTACLHAYATPDGATQPLSSGVAARNWSTANFTLYLQNTRTDQSVSGHWLAIGY